MNFAILPVDVARRGNASAIETGFVRVGSQSFSGYVFDALHPNRRFAVELLIDGHAVAVALSDRPCDDPAARTFGDGCHGFAFAIDLPVQPDAVIEARIANLGVPVGTPIRGNVAADLPPVAGAIRWLGALRFSGWIPGNDGAEERLAILIDEQRVAETRPTGWTRPSIDPADERVGRTFDFHVPQRFADNRLHRLRLALPDGSHLPANTPVQFVASPGGFASTLDGVSKQERLRAEFLDTLLPMSLPMSAYQDWRDEVPDEPPSIGPVEIGVITVGNGGIRETLASLEAQSMEGWVAAALPQTDDACGFSSPDVDAFLDGDGASCGVFVVALAGTRLAPTALQHLAGALEANGAAIAYADVEVLDTDGKAWPVLFPAFDYDRMLEQGYAAHVFAMRRDALVAALKAGATDLYRLFNAAADEMAGDVRNIVHVPGVLATLPAFDAAAASETLARASEAHIRARGLAGAASAIPTGAIFPAARIELSPDHADVAIVVTTRNNGERLRRCIGSLEAAVEKHGATIIVVDNDSSDAGTLAYLSELEAGAVTVVRTEGTRNNAHLANTGVESAEARLVCLIEDHVEALDDLWLEELVNRLADDEIGAVSPLILASGDGIANAGVVLGPAFGVAPASADRIVGDPGYGDLLIAAHQQSALAAGCVIVRRGDYRAVGGMDHVRFPNALHYIDFCLKLGAIGRRIVVTPHARMLDASMPATASERELANLRAKWGATLVADPFYSPLLSLDGAPFSALAWPPRPSEPRSARLPTPRDIPPGF